MQFLESIQTCIVKKYADFNGRASRSEFWWFWLATIIVNYAWSFIISWITGASVMMGMDGQFHFNALSLLGYIPAFALLLPSLAVSARRLHDIGKSGWWYLLAFVCCIGGLVLIYFWAKEGDKGSNEYGPAPQD